MAFVYDPTQLLDERFSDIQRQFVNVEEKCDKIIAYIQSRKKWLQECKKCVSENIQEVHDTIETIQASLIKYL